MNNDKIDKIYTIKPVTPTDKIGKIDTRSCKYCEIDGEYLKLILPDDMKIIDKSGTNCAYCGKQICICGFSKCIIF